MRHLRFILALVAVMAILTTGCEAAFEDSTAEIGEARPLDAAPPTAAPLAGVDGNADGQDGVERNVSPLPAPESVGTRLVALTADSDVPFVMDGANVDRAFDAHLVVDDGREVDRVVWRFDGEIFRDDDWNAPYNLRYAGAEFPIDVWVTSDQDLPGEFRAALGSTVQLTATVYSNDDREDVSAVFTIGASETPAPGAVELPVQPPPPTLPTTTLPTTTLPTTTLPTTTLPTTTLPTTTQPPQAGAPWSIPSGSDVAVALPQGQLGPRTATPIDPATISGISYSGGVWTMNRDWDETVDGGYLDFGAAALRPDGHRVLGFRIEVPANVAGGHLIDGGGEVAWFEVSNPDQNSHNSFIRHAMYAHHYIARGVVGDAIKVGQGSAHHHDAYIEMDVRPGGSSDKHYDGVQVFNQGDLRLERIVIEWADAGVFANTTGALFTQQNAAVHARDLLVLNPGGTWQPVRLSGSGSHDVDRIQVIGERRPNNNSPDKLAPTAAIKVTNGSGTFTVWNEVAGADDWLIE